MNEIGVPLIKSTRIDSNADGVLDSLDLHIELKSLPGRELTITQSIRNVKLIGTVDYSLKNMLQLEMISLFEINIDTPSGAAHIRSSGEIELM